jgi:hypothetical protein
MRQTNRHRFGRPRPLDSLIVRHLLSILFLLAAFAARAQSTVTWATNLTLLPSLPPVTPRQVAIVGNEVDGWTTWHWNAASTASTNSGVVKYGSQSTGRWIMSPITGTATNITVAGTTTYNGADEDSVSATGDFVLGLTGGLGKPTLRVAARSFQTIADMVASESDAASVFGVVDVMGYHAANDGGGGKFRKVLKGSQVADGGTLFATDDALWLWQRIVDGPIDVRFFGSVANAATNQTSSLQAAVSFAETSKNNRVVMPAGIFIGQVSVSTATIEGLRPSPVFASTNTTTMLVQPETPTAATVSVVNGSGGDAAITPAIRNLFIMGRGSVTTPNKRAITAVDSQWVFRVETNHAPTLTSVADYPAGVALFYTSTTNYLGFGFITTTTNVGAECIVTLDSTRSLFAATATNGLLTTLDTVVFAPTRSISGTPYTDPFSAGYAGVKITLSTPGVILDNVTVDKHHVGVQVQNDGTSSGVNWLGRNQINHCEFAGVGSAGAFESVDASFQGSLSVSGSYVAPTYGFISYPAETNTITNPRYRNTGWGFYNALSFVQAADLRTDFCVGGYLSMRESSSHIGYALFDNCIRYGVISRNGYYPASGSTGLSIDYFIARPYLPADATVAALTDKTALLVDGSTITNQVTIGALSILKGSAGSAWDKGIVISGITGHSVAVGKKVTVAGATSLGTYATGRLRWLTPSDAADATENTDLTWRSPAGTYGFAHSGSNLFTLAPAGATFYNNVTSELHIVPPANDTDVFSVATSSGQRRLYIDSDNGLTYVLGPGGAGGSDPTFNAGTTLVVKNNTSSSDRARIAVIGGTAGYSTLEMGTSASLPTRIQLDNSTSETLYIVGDAAFMDVAPQRRVALGRTVTTPDTQASVDLQDTGLPLKLNRMTAAALAAISSPGDGLIAYQTDGTEGVYAANGSSFSRLAKASELTSGTVTHTAGALTANAVVIGNGTDDVKVLASLGTSGQVLTSAGPGSPPSFAAVGNAATATALETARTINGVSFNGTANIALPEYIYVDSGAMAPFATAGATAATTTLATTGFPSDEYAFDASTDEKVAFKMAMPDNWNGTTLTAKFLWRSTATTGNCVWTISARFARDGDNPDTTFGTAVSLTDGTAGTANYQNISAASGTITPSGTNAAGAMVYFILTRDADNGSDTLAVDALLQGVQINWQ